MKYRGIINARIMREVIPGRDFLIGRSKHVRTIVNLFVDDNEYVVTFKYTNPSEEKVHYISVYGYDFLKVFDKSGIWL